MEIKLDPEAAATIASKAIFETLSEEKRDLVIQQAITYLLTPAGPSHSVYGGKTPLQQAFERALTAAAHKAVEDAVANDPRIKEGIDKLLGPLITSAIEAESQTYNDGLADKVGEALGQWLAQKAREGSDR